MEYDIEHQLSSSSIMIIIIMVRKTSMDCRNTNQCAQPYSFPSAMFAQVTLFVTLDTSRPVI
jgi:hypothetical protein